MPNLTRSLVIRLVFTAALAPTLAAVEPGAVWPQWRGPTGQGIANDADFPTEWDEKTNVAWKTPVPGRGFSSPIVWNDHVFLTTAFEGDAVPGAAPAPHILEGSPFVHPDSTSGDRKHTLVLMALQASTGKVLWQRTAYEGKVFDARHRSGSFANTTPATDGQLVYVWFGSEGLYAYDFNGRLAWKKSLGGIPAFGMGTGSSPVLFEDLLILQCDEDNGDKSFIVAVDKRTGRERWRTPRAVQASWTTPVIAKGEGRDELIASGNEFVIAYDPRTGKELWRVKGTGAWTVPTPIVGHGIVIASASHSIKRGVAVKLGGSGDVTGTNRVVWEVNRGTGYTPSSIAYGDYAYLVTDQGLLTCIDIRTGEKKYEGGRPTKPSRFWSSPVAFGDKILLSSEDGDTYVIAAGPTFRIERVNSLNEPIYASIAPVNGRLYIRTTGHLYAIQRSE